MTKSRYFTLCALVLAGTFAGAFAGSRTLPVVHAQVIGPNNVRGTAFTLVDNQGNVQATLRGGSMGAALVLNDATGQSRVEIGASGGIVIRDAKGHVTWSSPRTGVLPATE